MTTPRKTYRKRKRIITWDSEDGENKVCVPDEEGELRGGDGGEDGGKKRDSGKIIEEGDGNEDVEEELSVGEESKEHVSEECLPH